MNFKDFGQISAFAAVLQPNVAPAALTFDAIEAKCFAFRP